jgi:hypothetical protein
VHNFLAWSVAVLIIRPYSYTNSTIGMTARRPALGLRRSWSPASLPRFSGYVSEFIDIFSIGAARFEKANAKARALMRLMS